MPHLTQAHPRNRRRRGFPDGHRSAGWRRRAGTVAGVLPVMLLGATLAAAEVDLTKLPPAAPGTVDFSRQIQPIFEQTCFRCHGPEKPKSRFRLDNRESALKGGANNTDDIVPGDSAKSKLIHYCCRLVEDMEMPPPGKGEPLTPEQIGLLRRWIDQGATWPAESATARRETSFSATPMVQWIGVSGNRAKFREDWWQKDGFTAGYEHFEMRQPVGKSAELRVEGRALFDQHDYRVALEVVQPDLGFVRGGYENFRKYYNDVGGYYPQLTPPSYALDRDLHLDIGRAWFDVGLTLPDLPQVTLGYEYRYQEGEKSTLEWGNVTDLATGVSKNIYPASKRIDQNVHILKADITYGRWGWSLEDNARVELYDLNTRRYDVGSYTAGPLPDMVTQIHEGERHIQGANALHLEKQWTDWLFLSGGYLYSKLNGDASFNESTTDGSGAPAFGDQWLAQGIVLSQESHVFSVSGMVGPWQGLTVSAGVQQEWFHQEGFGTPDLRLGDPSIPLLFSDPIQVNSTMNKSRLSQIAGLRYTAIPFTVLYAEGRFQQEDIDQFEQQVGSFNEFVRDTDASNDIRDFRAGFRLSPWQPVSLDGSYRNRKSRSDYNHLTDLAAAGATGDGYPAFIRGRDLTTDEVQARLTWRARPWLKIALNYRVTATDYRTTTDDLAAVTPGGTVFAGNYDAHSVSLDTVFTGLRRLTLATTFSYANSRMTTAQNGAAYVVPYRGDLYTVLASANYALSDSTTLTTTYSYAKSQFGQDNLDGLPLGIDFERHGLQVGLSRRLLKGMTASLRYAYYRYREPTLGGANDYTAHGILATLAVKVL